jgi:ubiquinone/menaquinone biosynthesis C-methylase UbiE
MPEYNVFNDDFAALYLDRSSYGGFDSTIAFLEKYLHLTPGCHVLDQCCGTGDVSLALAKRGYNMTAVDIVSSYIDRARRMAVDAGVDVSFHAGDALAFMPDAPCDAAFNWWTSFGFFDDDQKNLSMLQQAARALKPGGYFALDYMNSAERRRRVAAADGLLVTENDKGGRWESRVDAARNMLVKTWYYTDPSGTARVIEGDGVKLYSAADMTAMFTAAGFCDVTLLGDYTDTAFEESSPRCIVTARLGG